MAKILAASARQDMSNAADSISTPPHERVRNTGIDIHGTHTFAANVTTVATTNTRASAIAMTKIKPKKMTMAKITKKDGDNDKDHEDDD